MVELINGMVVGGYRLVTLLQDGGDGRQVYLANELANENRRAVVQLHPVLIAEQSCAAIHKA